MSTRFEQLIELSQQNPEAIRTELPEDCVRAAREFFLTQRDKIRKAHEIGDASLIIVKSLSNTADFVVRGAAQLAAAALPANASVLSRVCLCALGGYGRAELSPYSDLDICVVYETDLDDSLLEFNRYLVHFLWDVGFKVGHSLRTVGEARELAERDIIAFTSLLESRLICGNPEIFAQLKLRVRELQQGEFAARFLQQKIRERFEELPQEYSDLFAPEPNVKENAGGLRDFHTAIWLCMMMFNAENLDDLVTQGHISPEEQLEFVQAIDFVWRIRNELHFRLDKAEDTLFHANQQIIAKSLGYNSSEQSSTLLVMQDYYAAAVQIRKFLSIITRICDRPVSPALLVKQSDESEPRYGIFVENGLLFAGIHDKNWFAHSPTRLIEVFWECARRNVQLSRATERMIAENLHFVNDTFQTNELVKRFFLGICNRPLQAGATLRQATSVGFLGRYIPEFEAVRGVLRYEDFHHYPVDEHTLQALEAIGKIPFLEGTVGRCLQEALEHLPDPYILILAILFHDLGKIHGEQHIAESVRIASAICDRIGLSKEDKDRVTFLVENHMLMNMLSQWRDTDDEHVIQNFVKTIKTEERLRALFLLSFADLYAVGPNVWNEWKGTLLLQLYLRTVKRLLGRAETLDEEFWKSEKANFIRQQLPEHLKSELENHLIGLGQRYFLAFSASEIAEHIHLIDEAKRSGLAVHHRDDHTNAQSTVVICTRDRHGLFSVLAGTFSSQLIDVNSAAVFTRPDGYIVDCFTVSDVRRQRPLTKNQVKTIERVLTQVLLEGKEIQSFVDQARSRLFALFQPRIQTPTRILFDNHSSEKDTVIDVETGDRTGLLYDITRAIAESGLNITTARIMTDARRVRDSFYVNYRGEKITEQEQQEVIRKKIHAAIHPRPFVETH